MMARRSTLPAGSPSTWPAKIIRTWWDSDAVMATKDGELIGSAAASVSWPGVWCRREEETTSAGRKLRDDVRRDLHCGENGNCGTRLILAARCWSRGTSGKLSGLAWTGLTGGSFRVDSQHARNEKLISCTTAPQASSNVFSRCSSTTLI